MNKDKTTRLHKINTRLGRITTKTLRHKGKKIEFILSSSRLCALVVTFLLIMSVTNNKDFHPNPSIRKSFNLV